MTEYFDIYDEHQVHIGVKERSTVHHDGDWHKVFHCWVVYRGTDGVDYLVMQKRGPDKDTYPSLFDISAAGHYQAGETIEDGIREVQEELGITVRFDELIPLGQRTSAFQYDDIIDRQFCDVFLLVHDQDIHEYHYQQEELDGLVVFSLVDGLKLFNGELTSIPVRAAGLGADELEVYEADFVPRTDNYIVDVMQLAIRHLNGEQNLKL